MKYILMFALLASAPVMANSSREAQSRLDVAQKRVNDCKMRVDGLSRKIDDSHNATQSIAGQYEYADDMEARKKNIRSTIEEYNKAVQELEQATKHLQTVIKELGTHHKVVENNENYAVVEQEPYNPEPIVTTPRPQPSYTRRTKSYAGTARTSRVS